MRFMPLLLLPILLVSCGDDVDKDAPPTTCEVATNQMKASFSAGSDDATTELVAAVFSGPSRTLGCGDALVVNVGGSRLVLEREPVKKDVIHYIGTIPTTSEARTITFALERPTLTGALQSKVFMPQQFTVKDVTPSAPGKTGVIEFKLDPPMAVADTLLPDTIRLRIQVEGSCVKKHEYFWKPKTTFPPEIRTDGTVRLSTFFFEQVGTEKECDLKMRIHQVTGGEIDPAFAGGIQNENNAEGIRVHPDVMTKITWP